LQKADLRYRTEQDGTLTYWVKDLYSRSLEQNYQEKIRPLACEQA
jgi:hypothetical protein